VIKLVFKNKNKNKKNKEQKGPEMRRVERHFLTDSQSNSTTICKDTAHMSQAL